jgi:hypothetical protein
MRTCSGFKTTTVNLRTVQAKATKLSETAVQKANRQKCITARIGKTHVINS